MTPRVDCVPRLEARCSECTTAADNTHSWCHSQSRQFVILGHVFPRALGPDIVITSNHSTIVLTNVDLGSLCVPAAGATTHLPTRCRGSVDTFWETLDDEGRRSRTTSEQACSAPSVWEPPISPFPPFPSSISRYGGAPATLLLVVIFDADRRGHRRAPQDEEARIIRQYGGTPLAPSSSSLVSHDTSAEEQVVPPLCSPTPSRNPEEWYVRRTGGSWDASTVYCTVLVRIDWE